MPNSLKSKAIINVIILIKTSKQYLIQLDNDNIDKKIRNKEIYITMFYEGI